MLITNNFLPVGFPARTTHFSYFAEFEVFIIISKFHVISFAKLGPGGAAGTSSHWDWLVVWLTHPQHHCVPWQGGGGERGEGGLKYWILTVRENIAIKLNLLSSLINFKYRLDLTSTTSGRCLTVWAVSPQQSDWTGTLHSHAPLTTHCRLDSWTRSEKINPATAELTTMPPFIGLSKFSLSVCKFYEDTKMVIILNQSYLQLLSTLSLTALSSPIIYLIYSRQEFI